MHNKFSTCTIHYNIFLHDPNNTSINTKYRLKYKKNIRIKYQKKKSYIPKQFIKTKSK